MAMARRLQWYLDSRGVPYEVLPHAHTSTSLETARAANVPDDKLAKPVLLEDEQGYVLAIVPASRKVALRALGEELHRDLELASEAEIARLFADCETGAMPPLGTAYGVPTVVDESLLAQPDVYFEAGDHEDVVHLSGETFRGLFAAAKHGSFSQPR
jgi:Ala-tRNA(Pro) deacylase